jgi:anti-sigma factor RsiW
MTEHYATGELLAHAYLPEDETVSRHLDACEECRSRFASVRAELDRHSAEAFGPEKSETFWKRQELGVMRAIDKGSSLSGGVSARIAAAAAILFVVTAFLIGRGSVGTVNPTSTVVTATVASTAAISTTASQDSGLTSSQITTDPWQSEQLQDLQTVVDWETWVEADGKKRGTI